MEPPRNQVLLNNTEEKSTGFSITSVKLTNLFGAYNYDLDFTKSGSPNLVILYGDNGSGKTTVLNIIFHLLSPQERQGHRTYIARTRFKEIAVILNNTITVKAVREKEADTSYYYEILVHGEKVHSHFFRPDPDGSIKNQELPSEDQESYETLLEHLESFGLRFHYLSDDRRLSSDEDFYTSGSRYHTRALRRHLSSPSPFDYEEHSVEARDENLRVAIARAEHALQREAYARTNRGSESANSVYIQLVKQLSTLGPLEQSAETSSAADTISSLSKIQARNKSYAVLGLVPSIDSDTLITLIENAPQQSKPLIAKVLKPYIDGVSARLDALKQLHDTIYIFLEHLNWFYRNKDVSYDLNHGINILFKREIPLEPSSLSSGEKQLLLLLCNVLAARNESSIFLIDEPELSLNVKWQRRLIEALLDCVQGSYAQFIFATHSLEIAAQYKRHVEVLEEVEDQEQRLLS